MDKNQMEMLSVKSAIERMVQNYISTYQPTNSYKEFFQAVERLVASFFVGQQIDNQYLVRSLNNGDLEIRFSTGKHCTNITFMLPETLRWRVDVVGKSALKDMDQPREFKREPKTWNGREWVDFHNVPMPNTAKLEKSYSPPASEQKDVFLNGVRQGIQELNPIEQLKKEVKEETLSITTDNNVGQMLVSTGSNLTWVDPNGAVDSNPIQGMVRYDPATECVFYYDGAEWIKMTTQFLRESMNERWIREVMNEANIRVGTNGQLELYKNGKWVQTAKSISIGASTPSPDPKPAEVEAKEEFDPFEAYERAKRAVKHMG